MDTITLRSGRLGGVLAPEVGGAITRVWLEAAGGPLDLFRPTDAGTLARRDPWGVACFPLVPWSNRIRDGRFPFGRHTVTLPRNHPPERHSIHGLGFQAAWHAVSVGPASATIEHRHDSDSGPWPWAYRATQRVDLAADRLILTLSLRNEADEPMPAGLGLHPYFPRTPRTRLIAGVRAVWLTDAEVMPVRLVECPPAWDLGRGLAVADVALDHGFVGWSGRAVLDWPERRARLVVTAGPPLGCLVVYAPPAQDHLCVEPVSHVTDAFNLAAAGRPDTGMLTLAPGASVEATVTFTPEVDVDD